MRARRALRREASGEDADFVAATDVDDRALEDRVYREAIDHGLDLAIVERAAIARKEIVDRCAIFEAGFAHSPSPWSACLGQAVGRVFGMLRSQLARTAGQWRIGCPAAFSHSSHSSPLLATVPFGASLTRQA